METLATDRTRTERPVDEQTPRQTPIMNELNAIE